jgi:hypothetical protein
VNRLASVGLQDCPSHVGGENEKGQLWIVRERARVGRLVHEELCEQILCELPGVRGNLASVDDGDRRIGVHRRALRLISAWRSLPPHPPSDLGLGSMAATDLVAVYPEVLDELRRRGLIRTDNLVVEYAEFLVARALRGTLA